MYGCLTRKAFVGSEYQSRSSRIFVRKDFDPAFRRRQLIHSRSDWLNHLHDDVYIRGRTEAPGAPMMRHSYGWLVRGLDYDRECQRRP